MTERAQVAEALAAISRCPSCSTWPGYPHINDCTVELCSICGERFISCRHEEPPDDEPRVIAGKHNGWMTVWKP